MAQGEHKNEDHVVVVVNGTATTVTIHGNPDLLEVVTAALNQTGNSGQPVENWELRGPDDAPITDLKTKFKKLDLKPGDVLYLNLRAGVGG
jgi:Protein of Unknown function (DUF2604)